jgi:hypothetical protein
MAEDYSDPLCLGRFPCQEKLLQAQSLRLRSRRGPKKAIGAVAASILTAVYHMLKDGTLYQDPGATYFDSRAKATTAQRLGNRMQTLGFDVQIAPSAP